MKIKLPLLILTFASFFGVTAYSQAAGDFRSAGSADWSLTSTWQYFDGTSWGAASHAPSDADGAITITAGDIVTISANTNADQLVVNGTLHVTGGVLYIINGPGTDLTVNGEIIIDNTTRIDDDPTIGGSTVDYKGDNLVQGGGFQIATTFDGPNVQTITGNGFNANITINNPNNVTVTQAQSYGAITFISGKIIAQGVLQFSQYYHNFTGQSSTSFIDGNVQLILYDNTLQSIDLPIGNGNNYTPAIFTVQQSSGTQTFITISPVASAPTTRTLPATLSSVASNRYINITATGTPGIVQASLEMNYNAADNVTSPANLRIAESNGGNWVDIGGAGNTIPAGTITSTQNFTTLGDFVLALGYIATTWTGNVDNDWANAGNWSTNAVPGALDDVTIPAGVTNNPVVSTAVPVHNINNNGILTITAAGTLSVGGNINNAGTIDASAGTVILNGTAVQTVTGGLNVDNLTVNNTAGVSLSGATTKVYGTYTPTAGVLTSNGFLTLASNALGTANIANAGSNINYIQGAVTVERYIPAKRAWRILTAPVSQTGSIYSNWQNNGVANGSTGADIFRPGGGNGFTAAGISSSILSYNSASDSWAGPSSTNATNLSGTGASASNNAFALFITGPFGSNHIASGSAPTTLQATGQLQTGTQAFSFTGVDNGKYVAIGNPYASPVDFAMLQKNNVANTMWVWDAQRSGTAYGGYVTFSYDAGSSSYDQDIPPANTAQTTAIQSGQAFFVQSTATGIPIGVTIQESDKTSASAGTNGVFFAPTGGNAAQQMRIILNRAGQPADAILLKFGGTYSKALTDDGAKMFNYEENLSVRVDTNYLGIERMPLPTAGDSLWLDLYALKANTSYSFTISPQNIPAGFKGYLVDRFLSTKTPIDFTIISALDFTTTTDKGSYGEQRFVITFDEAGTLASVLTNVKAWQQENNVKVQWATVTEQGIQQYVVERSANGQTFAQVGAAIQPRNSGKTETYDITDGQPLAGDDFYRVKLTTKDALPIYSNTVQVIMLKSKAAVTIYPNPVPKNQQLHFTMSNMAAGKYTLQLFSSDGRQVLQTTVQHDGVTSSKAAVLPLLAAGNYKLVLADSKGNIWKEDVLVQ